MLILAVREEQPILIGPERGEPPALLIEILDADLLRMMIGKNILIHVFSVEDFGNGRCKARLGFEADKDVNIVRHEVVLRDQQKGKKR